MCDEGADGGLPLIDFEAYALEVACRLEASRWKLRVAVKALEAARALLVQMIRGGYVEQMQGGVWDIDDVLAEIWGGEWMTGDR